jgi:predicted phage terminase large subunit-like protein
MKVVAAGRRFGKTAIGLIAVLDGHGPIQPDGRPLYHGAQDGGKVWWVVPDYPTAVEIWRDLKYATRFGRRDKNEVERRIELHSGGSVTVRSAHAPQALVAVGLDGVVVDEAAKVDASAWDFLRPALADRQGWCILISTPKGLTNWFHEKFQYAAQAPGWARWQEPSSKNPLMTAEELAAAKLDAPRMFRQEYEAAFEELEGAEWPASYFGDSIWFDEFPTDLVLRTIALDPSKGKDAKTGDYSAFVMLARSSDGMLWCEADLARRTAEEIVEQAIEWQRLFLADSFAVESNVFQDLLASQIARESQRRGIMVPVVPVVNTVNKQVRIRRLGPYLARGAIRMKNTPGTRLLVSQLREFPLGAHDDGPDALELALRTAVDVWNGRQRRGPQRMKA